MTARFRKILCPIDFDRISIPALQLALTMAAQNKGRVFLLYIIPKLGPARLSVEVEEIATNNLRAVAQKWLHGRVPYKVIVRRGAPVVGVLEAEAELDIDLVVMATHGRTGKKYTLLGSVAEQVVRRSICPVLTTRPI